MEDAGNTKRYGNRVPNHHTLRVRQTAPSAKSKWDVSTIRNISETGLLFYSSGNYEPGSEVEIRMMNPVLLEEIACSAKVVRCFPLAKMAGMYGVALEFADMKESDKEALKKTIEIFLKRKNPA